jgi:hypothetical protein
MQKQRMERKLKDAEAEIMALKPERNRKLTLKRPSMGKRMQESNMKSSIV